MKRSVRTAAALLLLLGALTANLAAAQAVEPRYTGTGGVTATLNISSSGGASCFGTAKLYSGYTADLTVELKKDGSTIKTWTDSGSGSLSAGGTYYVPTGHTYAVVTTVTVFDSNSKVVESPSATSPEKSY